MQCISFQRYAITPHSLAVQNIYHMHNLPKLPYSFDALEPHFDAQTMEIHYTKHHQGYADKFNAVIEKYPEISQMKLEDIFRNLNNLIVENGDKKTIKNFGGGFINHNIFWENLSPEKQIDNDLVKEIEETFGSIEKFKEEFSKAAATQFGSGWAWLVRDENGKLKVYSLPNQDSPYTLGHEPIFNLDVWEHAYYLKYQNKRADFIEAFWSALKLF